MHHQQHRIVGRLWGLMSACVMLVGMTVWPNPTWADVRLAKVFGDGMVLQRDMPVPVWGWAEPNEQVTVILEGQRHTTKADAQGEWDVELGKLSATTEPLSLIVRGKNELVVHDILVGEVWLCSGQSNMAMTVSRARDFDNERRMANFPHLRMFTERSSAAKEPQPDGSGKWEACSSDTVGGFSATAYFFGRALHQKLDVPIGLINSSVGGTAIESWTSMDVQKNNPDLKSIFDRWQQQAETFDPGMATEKYEKQLANWKEAARKARAEGREIPRRPQEPVDPRSDRNHPSNLFNGKINPLIPYAIRGAIWYQGENNARTIETATLYRKQLPLLVADWRDRWGQGDFPFAWVQLPNYKAPTNDPGAVSEWAVMRESMTKALSVPNSGMVVAIDVGETSDIHPKNKQAVGQRLAAWALASVYKQQVVASGPVYSSHEVDDNAIVVKFQHIDGGLAIRDGASKIKGFAIAGADKKWQWGTAMIDKEDRVVITHSDIRKPVAIRYGWADNPDCNLINGSGFPAAPFRTDDW